MFRRSVRFEPVSSCTEDVVDASDVVGAIQRLSRVSHDLSRTEAVPMQNMMEYGKAKLVAEAAMSPMLLEMSADGTPIAVFKHHSSRLPSG